MAMSGRVIPEFADVSGCLPSTVDRMVRDLRAAELAPMGKHGRGQQHGQYQLDHLANLIMAFAGKLPSDAAEAVKALRGLHETLGSTSFGEQVETAIRDAAAVWNAESKAAAQDVPFHLTMNVLRRHASITWNRDGKDSTLQYTPRGERAGLQGRRGEFNKCGGTTDLEGRRALDRHTAPSRGDLDPTPCPENNGSRRGTTPAGFRQPRSVRASTDFDPQHVEGYSHTPGSINHRGAA